MIATFVPDRWPGLFLGALSACVLVAFAADRIRAQGTESDIVIVPAAVSLELLQEGAPETLPPALSVLPTSIAQPATITVEVVKPTWWDDLWKIFMPILAAGGTYLMIWFWVQGRRLLAAAAVRGDERKVEAEIARDTNERVKDLRGGGK